MFEPFSLASIQSVLLFCTVRMLRWERCSPPWHVPRRARSRPGHWQEPPTYFSKSEFVQLPTKVIRTQ